MGPAADPKNRVDAKLLFNELHSIIVDLLCFHEFHVLVFF